MTQPTGIRCPGCGFCPSEEYAVDDFPRNSAVTTRDDELDCFEVSGMDDGIVLCPRCSAHVPIPPAEHVERIEQEMLF